MCTTTFLQLSNENLEYFPCAHFSLPIHKQILLVTKIALLVLSNLKNTIQKIQNLFTALIL